ncbi:MAG TPA: glutathione S-transferase N-terminal domain-containing protein [Pedomonas sp.]|uniref:glutathione S-transferase family protein n=1 Tax=Pedomonas sp. TaxID=2976421 RepID=UPI002F41802D
MITLYSLAPSGNAQKVRMALRFLGLVFEEVQLTGGAHKRPPFTDLKPLGQVPVLVDDEVVLRDSQAILVYLAAAYRPGEWDGYDAAERGRIAHWLSLAADEIAQGPNRLRLAALFGVTIDPIAAAARTKRALDLVERQLEASGWLEGGRLTIADLACAPYLALRPQGGVDLGAYSNVRAWTARVAALPGFPVMTGWGA